MVPDYVEVPPLVGGPSNQQVYALRPRTEKTNPIETLSCFSDEENDGFYATDGADEDCDSDGSGIRQSGNHKRVGTALTEGISSKRQMTAGALELDSGSKNLTAPRGRKLEFQQFFSVAHEAKRHSVLNGNSDGAQFSTQLQSCQTASDTGQHSHVSCGLLTLMEFVYLRELQVVACRQHQTILPLNSIKAHVDRYHPLGLPRNLKWLKIDEMLAHFQMVFPHAGTSAEKLALPTALSTPLDVFSSETIRYRYMCPETGCAKWIARTDTYGNGPKAEFHHHLSVQHQRKCWPTNVRGSWVQAIPVHSGIQSQGVTKHLFHLDSYQSPHDVVHPSFSTKTVSAAPNATWFEELQWCTFRKKIQHIPFHEIQALVAPPSKQLVEGQLRASKRRLESGLLVVRKHITAYIDNCQQFVSSIDGSYRVVLRPRYAFSFWYA